MELEFKLKSDQDKINVIEYDRFVLSLLVQLHFIIIFFKFNHHTNRQYNYGV